MDPIENSSPIDEEGSEHGSMVGGAEQRETTAATRLDSPLAATEASATRVETQKTTMNNHEQEQHGETQETKINNQQQEQQEEDVDSSRSASTPVNDPQMDGSAPKKEPDGFVFAEEDDPEVPIGKEELNPPVSVDDADNNEENNIGDSSHSPASDSSESSASSSSDPSSWESSSSSSTSLESAVNGDDDDEVASIIDDDDDVNIGDTGSTTSDFQRRRRLVEQDLRRLRRREARARRSRRRNAVLNVLCIPCMFLFTLFVVFMLLIFMGLPFAIFILCLLSAYYCCTTDPLPPRVLLRAMMDTDDWNTAGGAGHMHPAQRRFGSKHEIENELVQRICLGAMTIRDETAVADGDGEATDDSVSQKYGANLQEVGRTHPGRVHWRYEQDDSVPLGTNNNDDNECLVFSVLVTDSNKSEILQQVRDIQTEITHNCSMVKTGEDKNSLGDIEMGNVETKTSDTETAVADAAETHAEPQPAEDIDNVDDTSVRERGTVCDICLINFEAGDVIAWSTNPNCDHAYHSDCICDWLMRNNTCPSCRQEYLPPAASSSSSSSDSSSATSQTPDDENDDGNQNSTTADGTLTARAGNDEWTMESDDSSNSSGIVLPSTESFPQDGGSASSSSESEPPVPSDLLADMMGVD